MKTLKQAWISIFLLSFVFASCQKELSVDSTAGTGGSGGNNNGGGGGNTSGYYIKFKKDGVATTYTANLVAMIMNVGGATSFNIIGGKGGTSMEGLNIGINFSNGKQLEPGTYSEDASLIDYAIAGVYNPNSTTIVYGAGVFASPARPLKLVIATKTATEVTGTFEGDFFKTDLGTGAIGPEFISLTEGEFKLKIQ